MVLSIVYLLSLLLIVLAALGVGRPVVRALAAVDEHDEIALALWSVTVGLVLVGSLIMVLGLVGLLYPWLLQLLTFVAATAGLLNLSQLWHVRRLRMAGWLLRHDDSTLENAESVASRQPPAWLLGGSRWLLVLVFGATLISALAPPTAGDALCYHLELPKRFLLEQELVNLPYDDNATYPLLAEMWYLWGLALGGGVPAQLVHWFCGALLAGGTMLLAAPIVGRRWGEIAAALVMVSPGINNQMTAPLNDLALAMLTTFAVAAWWRGVTEDRGRGWYLLAGILLGGALATKYVALLLVAALGLVVLTLIVKQPARRKSLLLGMATTAVIAVSLAGPWYVRSAWYHGDPVYPMLSPSRYTAEQPPADKRPLGRGIVAAATAPWDVTMQPDLVGGRAHQLGPLWLAVLPGLVVTRRLRGLAMLLAVAGTFALLWFLLRQNVRFLYPLVPLVAVPAVWTLGQWRCWPRAPRLIATATVVMLTLFCLLIPLRRATKTLAVAVGVESRESHLQRNELTYSTARRIRELVGSDAHILSQELRAFYIPGRVTRESVYRRHTHYDTTDTAGLSNRLLQAGFTHLLLAEATANSEAYDPTLSRLVDVATTADPARAPLCLSDETVVDPAGVARRYRVMMLR